MSLRLLLMAALLPACGTTPDDRPATVEVISLEILAPTCGQVQCHSTTTRLEDLAFDTFDASRDSLRDMGVTRSPTRNQLWEVLQGGGEERMPPDSPLNDQDMALIQTWLQAGAPGVP
jgi:hypothetical protein